MKVFTKENMVFWETVTNATQYTVYLYIGAKIYYKGSKPNFLAEKHETENDGDIAYQKIDEITISKVKTYFVFSDLVDIKIERGGEFNSTIYTNLNYFVSVSAEDKLGNIIESSKLVLMDLSINKILSDNIR